MANIINRIMANRVISGIGRGASKATSVVTPGVTPNYIKAGGAGGMGNMLFSRFSRVGVAAGLGFLSNLFFKRLKGAPPNAPIMQGKRGIDGNNMNAAGVSLAMHRNRRSH